MILKFSFYDVDHNRFVKFRKVSSADARLILNDELSPKNYTYVTSDISIVIAVSKSTVNEFKNMRKFVLNGFNRLDFVVENIIEFQRT